MDSGPLNGGRGSTAWDAVAEKPAAQSAEARELLAKAEAESDDNENEQPQLPDRFSARYVFSFLRDPATALRWLMLALAVNVLATILAAAVALANVHGLLRIGAAFQIAALAIIGLPVSFWGAVNCLAIARDSASGSDEVHTWPGINITEWLLEAFFVFVSVALSLMPGYVLGKCIVSAGAASWVSFAGAGGTFVVLYPVILLSVLRAASLAVLVSGDVLASLSKSAGT